MTQLYEVPRNSWIKVVGYTKAPPGARKADQGEILKFHHIDGMYSYCQRQDGSICHVPAWQEVEIVLDTDSIMC